VGKIRAAPGDLHQFFETLTRSNASIASPLIRTAFELPVYFSIRHVPFLHPVAFFLCRFTFFYPGSGFLLGSLKYRIKGFDPGNIHHIFT
jgi:hypothetical protein